MLTVNLITVASDMDSSFLELLEYGKNLTPYAVEIRYPVSEEPTMEETKSAIEMAEKIKETILKKLPLDIK